MKVVGLEKDEILIYDQKGNLHSLLYEWSTFILPKKENVEIVRTKEQTSKSKKFEATVNDTINSKRARKNEGRSYPKEY